MFAKNNLEWHAHTLSGDAGADLWSQAGGITRNPGSPAIHRPQGTQIPVAVSLDGREDAWPKAGHYWVPSPTRSNQALRPPSHPQALFELI